MKKVFFLAATMSILISQTGCFGSFALVKKVYSANDSVNNKFIKTLLFYVLNIVPVYGVASFIDIVILNLIEFWTGSNPLSMENGQMEEQLLKMNGITYKITATPNKMSFAQVDGESLIDLGTMAFNTEDTAWNFEKDGESKTVVSFDLAADEVDFYATDGMVTVNAMEVECMAMSGVSASNTLAILAD